MKKKTVVNNQGKVTQKHLKETFTKDEIEKMMDDLINKEKYPDGIDTPMTFGYSDKHLPDEKQEKKKVRRREVLSQLMKWYKLPEPQNDDELEDRVVLFFEKSAENGDYLTVEKLALALGTTASTMKRVITGEIVGTPRRVALYKKAFEILHSVEADLASNFEVQPVVYMFRSKNYFDMSDRQEVTYTTVDPLGNKVDPKELQRLYDETIIDAEFEEID